MTDLANTDKRTVGNVDIFTLSIDEVGYSAQTDTKHSRKKAKFGNCSIPLKMQMLPKPLCNLMNGALITREKI